MSLYKQVLLIVFVTFMVSCEKVIDQPKDNSSAEIVKTIAPLQEGNSEKYNLFIDLNSNLEFSKNISSLDGDALVSFAKSNGFQRIMVQAKHISGTNYYGAEQGKENTSVDFVKTLSEACLSANLNFGITFSLIDQNNLGGANIFGSTADNIDEDLLNLNLDQINALLTNFPNISLIDFENGNLNAEQSQRILEKVKSAQPACMISGLLAKHSECLSIEEPIYRDYRFSQDWNYLLDVNPKKIKNNQLKNQLDQEASAIVKTFLEVSSMGGAVYLRTPLNAKGQIPISNQKIIERISQWMSGKSDLVYNATQSPFGIKSWGSISNHQSDNKLFVAIHEWPTNGQLNLYGLNNPINQIHPIGKPDQKLPFKKNGKNLAIALNGQFDKSLGTTILELSYSNPIHVTPLKMAYAKQYSWDLTPANSVMLYTLEGSNDYALTPSATSYTWHLPPTQGGQYNLVCKFTRTEADTDIIVSVNGKDYPISLAAKDPEKRPDPEQIIYGAYFLASPTLYNEPFTKRHGPTKGFPKGEKWGHEGQIGWQEQDNWGNGDERLIPADPMGTTYIYQSMYSQADQTMISSFKPDDGVTVWSNGNLITQFLNTRELEEVIIEIPVNAGNNQLMYKFFNNYGEHRIGAEHGVLAARFTAPLPEPVEFIYNQVTTIQVRKAGNSNEGLGFINFSIGVTAAENI